MIRSRLRSTRHTVRIKNIKPKTNKSGNMRIKIILKKPQISLDSILAA
jgi:hypothetical protein